MTDFDPDPNLPGYTYQRLADHMAAEIQDGRRSPGSRLASERDLAREYGVSTDTIRRTLVVLRDRGLVQTWRWKGTFVTESPAPDEPEA